MQRGVLVSVFTGLIKQFKSNHLNLSNSAKYPKKNIRRAVCNKVIDGGSSMISSKESLPNSSVAIFELQKTFLRFRKIFYPFARTRGKKAYQ